VYVSDFVITECAAGDPVAAQERLAFLGDIPQLDVTEDVETLAEQLLKRVPLPSKAALDAAHIAVAAVHGMDYFLTWNRAHIANAALRHRIERICRSVGYETPIICTPQELMEI
jgi:predicted nucleic acid-binding protein